MSFIKAHPARIYAVVVAVLALAADYGLKLPSGHIMGVIAALIGLVGGEAVQRVENAKTADAFQAQDNG